MAQTVELDVTTGAPRPKGPDPLIGQSLLHYRVVEVIGQGGMSVVYRGRDEHLQRDVAIKVLHPFLAEKAECRARLAREARAVARLEHPHILKVFDFSGDPPTVDETPVGHRTQVRGFAEGFIVAELVRGPTLKKFSEEHELWKYPEIGAMVVWQIAKALEHAHANGVVHRDLKPENVMVRDDGWLKLMDFGIAHIADQKGLTITGTLLGSPAHMAPECIDGEAADERSDLFSLGTVLYWITTGFLPFEALTPHALLKQIVEGRSVPAQQRSPRISDDLARVIRMAMATKPADRFQNAAAFVTALEEVLARAGMPASAETLRRVLHDPVAELPLTTPIVRAAQLKRAETLLSEGQPARALSCLSRVLAEDKDDVEAKTLLERAQSEGAGDDTGDDDDPITANELPRVADPTQVGLVSQPTTSPTGTVPPVILERSASVTVDRPPVGRWLRQAALVGVTAALIAGAIAVARIVDEQAKPDDGKVATNEGDNGNGNNGNGANNGNSGNNGNSVDNGMSTGDPARTDTPGSTPGSAIVDERKDAKDRDGKDAKDRGKDGKDRDGKDRDAKDNGKDGKDGKDGVGKIVAVGPPDVAPPAATKRPVNLFARPWADMFVDGNQVGSGKKQTVELSPGAHVVVFRAKGAKDVEMKIDVPAEGPVSDVKAELQPLPALLVVRCNQPDALVQVTGQGAKSAAETQSAAIVVPLGSSRGALEVTVFKKGFVPYVKRVDFTAGETRSLDVMLERQPDEGAPAPTP